MNFKTEDQFGLHHETKHMMTGDLRPIFAAIRTGHFSSAAENANTFPSVQPADIRDFNTLFFFSLQQLKTRTDLWNKLAFFSFFYSFFIFIVAHT